MSTLPGVSARHVDFLNSAVNAGQVIGVSGGLLLMNAGYSVSYATIVSLALASFAALREFRPEATQPVAQSRSLTEAFMTYQDTVASKQCFLKHAVRVRRCIDVLGLSDALAVKGMHPGTSRGSQIRCWTVC